MDRSRLRTLEDIAAVLAMAISTDQVAHAIGMEGEYLLVGEEKYCHLVNQLVDIGLLSIAPAGQPLEDEITEVDE